MAREKSYTPVEIEAVEIESSDDDEEELFSYLKQVQEVKQTKKPPGDKENVTEKEPVIDLEVNDLTVEEASAIKWKGSDEVNSKQLKGKNTSNVEVDDTENKSNKPDLVTEQSLKQPMGLPNYISKPERTKDPELEIGVELTEILSGDTVLTRDKYATERDNYLTGNAAAQPEQNIMTLNAGDNSKPIHESNTYVKLGQNVENHIQQSKNSDTPVSAFNMQTSDNPPETDKYYLINEKDWLSLCSRLSNATGDTEVNLDKPEIESPLKRSVPLKHTSMFDAFKQYSPVSKASLNKSSHAQSCQVVSCHKEGNNVNGNFDFETMNTNRQKVSLNNNESSQISECSCNSSEKTQNLSPSKVEIVYVRLEDNKVKYDNTKCGASRLDEKICTVEPSSIHQNQVSCNQRCSQKNTDSAFVDAQCNEQEPFVPYSTTGTSNTPNTDLNTTVKPGMPFRFVRVNNKLTRVYENVVEEGVDLYAGGYTELTDKPNTFDQSRSHVEMGHLGNESFDLNDGPLVAYPVNYVDAENVAKDGIFGTLTPTKFQMFSPSKLEMFTPSKLEVLTPSKLNILDEWDGDGVNISCSTPEHYIAQPLCTANINNEKVETEAPIVLKVTGSGELVECKGNENSPIKKPFQPESPMTDTERRSRNRNSHIKNLWKNIRPHQDGKKQKKQNLPARTTENSDEEVLEIETTDRDQSSDEDDLTNYFCGKFIESKRNVNTQRCNYPSNSSQERTISIEPSFSEAYGSKQNGPESAVKVTSKNLTSCSKKSKQKIAETKTDILTSNSCKFQSNPGNFSVKIPKIGKEKTHRNEMNERIKQEAKKETKYSKDKGGDDPSRKSGVDKQTDNKELVKTCRFGTSSIISDNACSYGGRLVKKKKRSGKIRPYFKEIQYKQVEFEDFEVSEIGSSQSITASNDIQRGDKIKVNESVEENVLRSTAKYKNNLVNSAKEIKGKKFVECSSDTSKGRKDSTDRDFNTQKEGKGSTERVKKSNVKKSDVQSKRKSCTQHPSSTNITEESEIKVSLESTGKSIVNDSNTSEESKDKTVGGNRGRDNARVNKTVKKTMNETDEVVGIVINQARENEKHLLHSKQLNKKQRSNTENVDVKSRRKRAKHSSLTNSTEDSITKVEPLDCIGKDSVKENPNELADNSSETDERQRKIEFLETLFQVKLKEAAHSVTGMCKSIKKPSLKAIHDNKGNSESSIKMQNNIEQHDLNALSTSTQKAVDSCREKIKDQELHNEQSATNKSKNKQGKRKTFSSPSRKCSEPKSRRKHVHVNLKGLSESKEEKNGDTVADCMDNLYDETVDKSSRREKSVNQRVKSSGSGSGRVKDSVTHCPMSNKSDASGDLPNIEKKDEDIVLNIQLFNEKARPDTKTKPFKRKKGESEKKKSMKKMKLYSDKHDSMSADEPLNKDGEQSTNEPVVNRKSQRKCGSGSPKKLRSGRDHESVSKQKTSKSKTIRSSKMLPSSGKLKINKFEEQSWKAKLEDEAFKYNFDQTQAKKHKPVNVRRMIRKILQSTKGADKMKEVKVKHRQNNDMIRKFRKERNRKEMHRLTSESDDAWLSDSGPSRSFPAFKFAFSTSLSEDSESDLADKEFDNRADELCNRSKSLTEKKALTNEFGNAQELELQFTKGKVIGEKGVLELHYSPQEITNLQTEQHQTADGSPATLMTAKSTHIGSLKESPEAKNSVDKIRLLIDKIREKKKINKLNMVENKVLSDS